MTQERRLLTFKCFPLEINKMLISIYNFIIVGEAVMLSVAFLANLLSLITETVVPVKSAMQK